jgi:3-phenylpropionate/trans-cinnamate dioxygenase ferredoxin subunit
MSRDVTVGPLAGFEDGVARRVDSGDTSICVVRCGDAVYAINDVCSHEDYSLSVGEVDVEECAIECWKHGSLFSLVTGAPLTFPATRPVATYEVSIDADQVVVHLLDDAGESADDAGQRDGAA